MNEPTPKIPGEPESRGFLHATRRIFFQGLAITVPLFLTYWVLKLFFNTLDSFLDPVFRHYFGRHIPGLGLVSAIVVVLFIGLVTRNLVGKMVVSALESLLLSVPLVKSVYNAAKELMDAFAGVNRAKIFRQVLLVEYPRRDMYSVGFVTNEIHFARTADSSEALINVYIPHPPNPTSGMFILLPVDQAVPLDITVEEGLKLVLSGGIVSPATLKARIR